MGFSRVPMLRRFPVYSPALPYSSSLQSNRKINISASLSRIEESTSSLIQHTPVRTRWKPMCLYFTQGKCTKVIQLNLLIHTSVVSFSIEFDIDKFVFSFSIEFYIDKFVFELNRWMILCILIRLIIIAHWSLCEMLLDLRI